MSLANHELSAEVAAEAVSQPFGSSEATGIGMAIRATRPSADADVVSASFTALVSDRCRLPRVGRVIFAIYYHGFRAIPAGLSGGQSWVFQKAVIRRFTSEARSICTM